MGIFSFLSKEDTLYFPGCINYYKYKENFVLYKEIFGKLGIDFVELDEKICCGVDALEAGYENEARKLARKNVDLFKKNKIKKIITTSPAAYKGFLQNYPQLIPDWDVKVENIWEIISDKINGGIKNKTEEVIAYHDSCYLGRYCGVYDEPRKILSLIGYKIKEFPYSKENAICCGSCGGLPRVNPQLADEIARDRLLQAKRIGVKKIVVIGFDNYQLLNKNSHGLGIEVVEMSTVLAGALGLIEVKTVVESVDEKGKEMEETDDMEDDMEEGIKYG